MSTVLKLTKAEFILVVVTFSRSGVFPGAPVASGACNAPGIGSALPPGIGVDAA